MIWKDIALKGVKKGRNGKRRIKEDEGKGKRRKEKEGGDGDDDAVT